MLQYKVLDLMYTEEEGQDSFSGTEQECYDFISSQCSGGCGISTYKVVPLTEKERKIENEV